MTESRAKVGDLTDGQLLAALPSYIRAEVSPEILELARHGRYRDGTVQRFEKLVVRYNATRRKIESGAFTDSLKEELFSLLLASPSARPEDLIPGLDWDNPPAYPPSVAPGGAASPKSEILLHSKSATRVHNEARCCECGIVRRVWRYAESNRGPVHICDRCKPAVRDRSFGRIDALDRAELGAGFETDRTKH